MFTQAPHECLPSTKMDETRSQWRERAIFGIFQRARRTPSKVCCEQVKPSLGLILSKGLEDENEFLLVFDNGIT